MRIYIDIAHPAHAHALRFFIALMQERGHEVLVTARDKDITYCLLRAWGIPFTGRGKGAVERYRRQEPAKEGHKPVPLLGSVRRSAATRWRSLVSLADKVAGLARAMALLIPLVRKFRPNLVVSYSSYHAALTGRLLGCPVLTFEDTEDVPLLHLANRLLSSRMVTPSCFERDFGRKHIRFKGYKELASLHPSRFIPLPLPGEFNQPYTVLRFVSWAAWHDRGHPGISERMKAVVAERLSEFGRVFIFSEVPLEGPLKRYEADIDCRLGHSVLAGASLFFGESASMAAEAAVLGVPAIYIDNDGRGYTRDLERHGLLFSYGEDDASVQNAVERAAGLLGDEGTAADMRQKQRRMMEGKIDVTAWMAELAERAILG